MHAEPPDVLDVYHAVPDLRLLSFTRKAGLAACVGGLAIWVIVILLYLFDLPGKIGFRITPTALALGICVALILVHSSTGQGSVRLHSIQLLSFITLFVSLLTLVEYFTGSNFGVDLHYVGPPIKSPITTSQARMSPNSALAFLLIGGSVFLQSITSRFTRLAQILALIAALVAMLALIGHSYGVGHFYSFAGLAAMSLVGAISFLLFSFSAIVIRPTEGILTLIMSSRAGGSTARRLLIAVVAVPPLLGTVSLLGYNTRLYDTPFGISLLVIMSMIIFATLTLLVAVRLETADARRTAVEKELSTSREELRELSIHVQAVQEEERIRIAREIHDELGQSLTALKMDVSVLKQNTTENDEELRGRLDGMIMLVDTTIRSVQRISTELRPGVLDDLGLTAALEWQSQEFQRRTGISCVLTVIPQEVLTDQERSTALFRIFQETLTNVARHSFARKVSIHLKKDLDEILLRITDDGQGISAQSLTRRESIGLIGMRERANLLGGTIEITGVAGEGTTVEVRLPLNLSALA
jgi:signal transduction histidine kinase